MNDRKSKRMRRYVTGGACAFSLLSVYSLTACSQGQSSVTGQESGSSSRSVASSALPSSPRTSTANAVDVANAFVALAEGKKSTSLEWGDKVNYYIGADQVGDEMTSDSFPAGLKSCPPGTGEYEQRKCPVSPLDSVSGLVRAGLKPSIEPGVPDVAGCSTIERPDSTRQMTAVTIRPPDIPEQRNCFSDFAITLFLDGSRKVGAVQFTLSGG